MYTQLYSVIKQILIHPPTCHFHLRMNLETTSDLFIYMFTYYSPTTHSTLQINTSYSQRAFKRSNIPHPSIHPALNGGHTRSPDYYTYYVGRYNVTPVVAKCKRTLANGFIRKRNFKLKFKTVHNKNFPSLLQTSTTAVPAGSVHDPSYSPLLWCTSSSYIGV